MMYREFVAIAYLGSRSKSGRSKGAYEKISS